MTVRSLETVHRLRYFRFCNVLHIWTIRAIPTYRVYRLYDTLQNRKYLSLCTDIRLLTVTIVTYVWNTTSTQSGTFQNGRLHTEPDTVKNQLFSFFLLLLSVGLTRYSLNLYLYINPLHFLKRISTIPQFSKIFTSPKRHFFQLVIYTECM